MSSSTFFLRSPVVNKITVQNSIIEICYDDTCIGIGLFHRAISQSGSSTAIWALQRAFKDSAQTLAEYFNCSTESSGQILACLQSKDEKDLVKATNIMTDVCKILIGKCFVISDLFLIYNQSCTSLLYVSVPGSTYREHLRFYRLIPISL